MSSSKTPTRAGDILTLLAAKHASDVFVPQCKDGMTVEGHVQFDAWAMKRSWTRPCTDGYEIKVSRSDFLRDDKWRAYLPFCNQFWFACPAKLIAPEELPPDVGLLRVSSTGGSFFTKRKAVWRKVEIAESLWKYIVMCRAQISHTYPSGPNDNEQYWRQWLAQKEEGRELGGRVAEAIRVRVAKTESENKLLKKQMATYDDVRTMLVKLGVSPDSPWCNYEAEQKVKDARQIVPPDLIRRLRDLSKTAKDVADKLSQATGTKDDPDEQP